MWVCTDSVTIWSGDLNFQYLLPGGAIHSMALLLQIHYQRLKEWVNQTRVKPHSSGMAGGGD